METRKQNNAKLPHHKPSNRYTVSSVTLCNRQNPYMWEQLVLILLQWPQSFTVIRACKLLHLGVACPSAESFIPAEPLAWSNKKQSKKAFWLPSYCPLICYAQSLQTPQRSRRTPHSSAFTRGAQGDPEEHDHCIKEQWTLSLPIHSKELFFQLVVSYIDRRCWKTYWFSAAFLRLKRNIKR